MRRRLILLTGLGLAVALAATLAFARLGGEARRLAASAGGGPPVSLKEALAVSKRLGPVTPGRTIHLVLVLRARNQAELDKLFSGSAIREGTDFAARYGPDPQLVEAARAALERAGFRTSSTAGSTILSADGPARLVQRYFHVRLSDYLAPGGRRFYAANRPARIPPGLRKIVRAVGGLDNYARNAVMAVPQGGVSPKDVTSFYNIKPLVAAGLKGAGETVVFPELMSPADVPQLRRDLDAYARKYKLPLFGKQVTFRSQPDWQPLPDGNAYADNALEEAALDLEIVHALAPKARLIVYLEARDVIAATKAETAMVAENPTAIISDSIGFCESIIPNDEVRKALEAPWVRQQAQNMSHFVASGDSGAYTCGQDRPAATSYMPSVPVNTGVGGTSVFLARSGDYHREVGWGSPLARTGGGGGVSRIYARPAYQSKIKAPGKGRAVPDVSGLGDFYTGWNISALGKQFQVGGTSASAPLWAGIAALINESLRKKGLRRIGFANPGLYWIAARNSKYKAFHDVSAGNNLLYVAKTGYDLVTGLGTPDVAALNRAFEAYQRQAPQP